MAKQYIHEGIRTRFWSGKVETRCGVVLDKSSERCWWSGVSCPACKRAKRAGR